MADDGVVVLDDDDNCKIVTKFIFNTCRLLLQPSLHNVQAAVYSCALAKTVVRELPDDYFLCRTCVDEVHYIPLITGSSAEFYIEPMSCVGDVDIMFHCDGELAIPDGYPPPTELPAEFHSRVKVLEIIDSEYPGYVYLMRSYLLTEDSDAGKYNAVRYDKHAYYRWYTCVSM